jgi:hypothetical protein
MTFCRFGEKDGGVIGEVSTVMTQQSSIIK